MNERNNKNKIITIIMMKEIVKIINDFPGNRKLL